MNHNRLAYLAKKAQKPLPNNELEDFQGEYFGDFRHWYYRFFYHIVSELKPAIALEIGTHHGHGVIHMARACPETIAIGVDKIAHCADYGRLKYGPSNCRIIYGDSLDEGKLAVEALVQKYGPIGLVFQDSSHHYYESHKEFNIYSQFLAPGAIWTCDDVMDVFHDPNHDPPGKSMLSYFNELPGDKRLYDKLHHGSVIGITIL